MWLTELIPWREMNTALKKQPIWNSVFQETAEAFCNPGSYFFIKEILSSQSDSARFDWQLQKAPTSVPQTILLKLIR